MSAPTPSDDAPCPPHYRLIGIGLVNLATLSWATNVTLGRWLRSDVGPLTLSACRFTIAALVFALLLRRLPAEERRLGPDRWSLAAMALTGVVTFSPLLYLGLRYTTAVNATLINGLGPLITGLIASLLIREPMSRRQITGALVSLVGVIGIISGGSLAVWQAVGISQGDFIVLGAATLWAVYSVIGRRVTRHRSPLSATALSAFLALPLLWLAAAWEIPRHPPALTPHLALATLYIGIVPTVVGFSAWNAGVRRLGASGAMTFYNTLPLYGALLGSLLLGESIGLHHLVGGALIIGGGLWAARSQPSSPCPP